MKLKSVCFECGVVYSLLENFTLCTHCGGVLVTQGQNVKEYFKYLLEKYQTLSLGEGKTPLVQLAENLFIKCEQQNPTGSFKDRGSILEVAFALENGYKSLVFASTGNMAVSLSAYCARAKIRCRVLVPKNTPLEKVELPKYFGANIEVSGDNYDESAMLAKAISLKENCMLAGDYLLRRVGQESCGEEIQKSLGKVDRIIVPVGNGTILSSIAEGYFQGNKKWQTKIVGVQGAKCSPIYLAWLNSKKVVGIKKPATVGAFFKVGNPCDGNIVLDWIQKTEGAIITITDKGLEQAKIDLAIKFGLLANLTSACVWAAYDKLVKNKFITTTEKTVLVITGR